MKRMLFAITLLAAVAAGYSSGAAAQQVSRDDLRPLHDQNQEPVAATYGNREEESPESRSPQKQWPQASTEDALRSASQASGLAPVPHVGTVAVRIEQIPGPFGVEEAARLIGMSAVSRRGEEIGEISAVVRSPTDGFLAVVDAGDYFGVGARPLAVPIKPDRIDHHGNLRVQASREELERLPIFATNLIE